MSDTKYGPDIPAHFYGGGPLDGKTRDIDLDNGALPQEWHCAMPLPPVTAIAPTGSPFDVEPLRVGVYRLNSARSTTNAYGVTTWVDARYRWIGEQ